MVLVSKILSYLETIAPASWAFDFDKVGLQIGSQNASVTGVITTLDCTKQTVDKAISVASNLIISHHPMIWEPLVSIETDRGKGEIFSRMLKAEISLIAAHTNWDCAPEGINDSLCEILGLLKVKPFGSRSDRANFKVVTFVPAAHLTSVSQAVFDCGAGRYGLYQDCGFVSEGMGTFRGLTGSNPSTGNPGEKKSVPETRFEAIVDSKNLDKVLDAIRATHPYEVPVIDVTNLVPNSGYPIGRIGQLPHAESIAEFANSVISKLETSCFIWSENETKEVNKIAVVGGAADDEWRHAMEAGADLFLTGEVKHHNAVEGSAAGLALVQAGHFATEQPGMRQLALKLKSAFPQLNVSCFEPEVGMCGRPII